MARLRAVGFEALVTAQAKLMPDPRATAQVSDETAVNPSWFQSRKRSGQARYQR